MSMEIVNNTLIGVYEGLEDLWASAKRAPLPMATCAIEKYKKYAIGESWEGCEGPETAKMSVEQAKEWLMGGWADGEKRAAKNAVQIVVPNVRQIKRRGVWAENGDDLSQDRLYAGDIDTMWRTTKKKAAIGSPRVKICVQVGGSARVNPEQLFWRYAAAAPLADALVKSGYHVAIDAFSITTGTYRQNNEKKENEHVRDVAMVLRVKQFTQPLNEQYFAAITGHAAFFRRMIFMWFCAGTNDVGQDTNSWLGLTANESYLRKDAWKAAFRDEGALTLFVNSEILSKDQANAWVTDALVKIQGEIPAP